MAKPRSIDNTGKRCGDARISVRLTSMQLARLKREAKKKKISLGELVRLRALGNKRAA
jgi:hypothetical protein